MVPFLLLAAAAAVCIVMVLRWRRLRRPDPRTVRVREVLDAADGLEARLRQLHGQSGAAPDNAAFRMIMEDMLQHRLWLRDRGPTATLEQLGAVRDALRDGLRRIDRETGVD